MIDETREIRYDKELGVEAYRFRGLSQAFPNHFHEHYAVGLLEEGTRRLVCMGREYEIGRGDLLLLNPSDSHACTQVEGGTLDFRGVSIPAETMRRIAMETYGEPILPLFSVAVVRDCDIADSLRELHETIMMSSREPGREEFFLFTMEQLLRGHSKGVPEGIPAFVAEIESVRRFIEEHYDERVGLDRLSEVAGLSKYHLIRSFTKQVGISPYAYMETVRVSAAKDLLSQGVPPVQAAQRAGFSDQSHFTRFFKKFIGLTPAQYAGLFKDDEGKISEGN